MLEFLRKLFATDFVPHGYCMRWASDVVWLHVISDGLTALAYFTIPFTLLYFVRRRRDLAFNWMFVMFGVFILACGTTHVMGIWTLWQPVYRLDGVIKAITALASVPTALLLIRLVPQAINLPSPQDLAREVATRRKAEEDLMRLNLELEERVQQRTLQLSRYNDALKRVAYIASHDLQEPLRIVVSYNQLLSRRYDSHLDDTGREYLKYSEQSARRMQTLVLDVLEYARAIGQADTQPMSMVNSRECADGAIRMVELAIHQNGVKVEVDELPVVLAEPVQLQQVFQNLIENAVKYRDPERACVVKISAKQRDGEYLFQVADNGIGFDPQYSEYIFEAFRRLQGREVPGSGVGLSICKTAIESFGGKIWAESERGRGTTFFFTLKGARVPVETTS